MDLCCIFGSILRMTLTSRWADTAGSRASLPKLPIKRVLVGDRKNMNHALGYRKPVIVDVGSVMQVIGGTLIKGHRGIIEAIHWRIIPAYDLDE
jgi:hypothetical protein